MVPPLPDGRIEEIVDLSSDDSMSAPILPTLSDSGEDEVFERKPDYKAIANIHSGPEVARDTGNTLLPIKLEPIKLDSHQYMCTHCGTLLKRRHDATRHMSSCRVRRERQTVGRAAASIGSRSASVSRPSTSYTDAQCGEAASVQSDPGSHVRPPAKQRKAKAAKSNRHPDGIETFVPERKPTTPAKVYAPVAKKARQSAVPRQPTAAEEATSPARFSHQAFGRIVATFSHLSDEDILVELQRRMPRVPSAMLASHLDTARAVMSSCANRLSLVAGIVNEPSARMEISQLIRDWGCPDV